MDPRDLEILYEDNHLLAVYKPAGVLSQGDATGDPTLLDAAKAWLKDKYAKPGNVFVGLVHRLDRPVAGVLLFAKTSKAAGRLSAEFREGRVEKVYRAVVEGTPDPSEQTLRGHVLKDEEAKRSQLVEAATAGAREAELEYRVLGTRQGVSLLEVVPKTGRSHQIRVQLAGIGHPILGDVKYGASAPLPGGVIALYARALSFRHPTRDEVVEIAAGPPPGWPWKAE
jgi:23S rRNA pseudouridine1911/1915/1917 synthase